ncbi:MAG: 23S rRNA (adenine(2030)-N(6))-methyltransferase RlmJ [Pseudomonadota bacterium]
MLAYRHAFHAGNHADVLKHLALAQVLRHMAAKDKPYTLIDTHAGAGGYSLEGRYAHTKDEFQGGIAKLYPRDDLPAALADYVGLVREFNGGGSLEQYPGSPAIANLLLRPGDRLRLHELHPTDERILRAFLGERPNTFIAMSDGFAALAKELPPPSRRGVVLIDPSYEMKSDYAKVLAAVREVLEKFASAVVLVWIPQLRSLDSKQLPQRLQNSAAKAAPRGWLHARLTVAAADARGYGLLGSSMFVINPPHGLHDTLRDVLPVLVEELGQYDGANFLLEQQTA